jgi:plastocyanin
MFTRKTRLVLVTLTGALLVMACGRDYGTNPGGDGYGATGSTPPPAGNTVDATPSLTFTPDPLRVSAGNVVTFVFGTVAHNVFFTPQAGAPADIAGNNANVSITRTFATAGTYTYTCHIHPSMQGTVVVQ